ncbi:cache domain-containing sensor histidine kinase [Brevibacillus borstelensis]|uniref:Integral membrane sensor signal transduction histidine kinase n=1 Tax=Brevibacillus borstelensis AK1 TaxID=1300222 RepID=M8DY33_9BACL|nr:sensor histidine kinase [Brevibacillus borstelensis]EMT51936.1 integral membrane sensor signal transduction histidine kinase [Brevibacillus borstelensis AK1]
MLRNLRHKLIVAFIGFIIIPLCLLGAVTYVLSQNAIQQRYGEHTEETLKALGRNLQYVLSEIGNVSDAGITSPALQPFLTANSTSQANELLETNEAEMALRRVFFIHPAVQYVALYRLDGRMFKTFRPQGQTIPYETFIHHPIVGQAIEKNGHPVWIGPYEQPDLSANDKVFTQVRLVKDMNNFDDRAILLMEVKINELHRMFSQTPLSYRQNGRYLIANKQGTVLYDSRTELGGTNLLRSAPFQPDLEYQSYRGMLQDEDSLFSVYKLPASEWYLVSVASWATVSHDSTTIARWVGGVLLLSLIAALLFNMLFVNRITQTIIQIVRLMKRAERGDLTVRAKPSGDDELTRLAGGFNSMVGTIQHLLEEVKREQERKKRAELALLQAQIHPHFLFNTLESINVLAIQNEGHRVSQMIYRLGNILRISISDREHIPIRRELEHLRSYLEIQSFRFENLFSYEIQIPVHLYEYSILKLTLQPLVENSIQHGFEGISRPGFISITAEERQDSIVLTVRDNGKGMTADQLALLAESGMRKQAEGQAKGATDGRLARDRNAENVSLQGRSDRRGLGVANVADRIRISYGRAYGLFLCSMPGEGTTVRCVIPKYSQGELHEAERHAGG